MIFRVPTTGLAVAALSAMFPLAAACAETAGEPAAGEPTGQTSPLQEASPEKKLFRGRVVLLRDALQQRGIASTEEFKGQVVLETPEGKLIPIVPDWRGRAFYQDERLRHRKVELVGHRQEGVPYLQVLMIFTFDEQGQRQYTDYWCDICSIPMYEIKPCDCCQGDIRLRYQHRNLPDYLHMTPESASAADNGNARRESQQRE